MTLPKADPDKARRGLKQLRKKFTMTGRTLPELMIVDETISIINRMEEYQHELEQRIAELEAPHVYNGIFAERTEKAD